MEIELIWKVKGMSKINVKKIEYKMTNDLILVFKYIWAVY